MELGERTVFLFSLFGFRGLRSGFCIEKDNGFQLPSSFGF